MYEHSVAWFWKEPLPQDTRGQQIEWTLFILRSSRTGCGEARVMFWYPRGIVRVRNTAGDIEDKMSSGVFALTTNFDPGLDIGEPRDA